MLMSFFQEVWSTDGLAGSYDDDDAGNTSLLTRTLNLYNENRILIKISYFSVVIFAFLSLLLQWIYGLLGAYWLR